MSGLLYPQPEGVLMDPRSQMIMQTGLGLLAAGGPQSTPVGLGHAFGQAGAQGMQAFRQTQAANQQQQMFQMKLAEEKRAEEERKKREAGVAALMQDPKFAQFAPLLQAGVPMSAIVERAMPKEGESPFAKPTVKDYTPDSIRRFSMTRNPADLVAVPDTARAPAETELAKAIRERAALPDGHPNRPLYDAKIKKLTEPSSPLVQMGQEETSFQKRVGTEFGDMYSGLMRADMNAPANIAKYQRLEGLLSQVKTGKFTGTTQHLKAAAKSVGIDLEAMGVKDDVAPAQAAVALSNQLALELRNPAGGAGMPGAMSDQDRQFLVAMVPGLENDPNAIPTMIDYRVRLAKREQQVAKMARAYRKKHGKFDEGFYEELAEWSAKNHLFANEKKSNVVDFGSLK